MLTDLLYGSPDFIAPPCEDRDSEPPLLAITVLDMASLDREPALRTGSLLNEPKGIFKLPDVGYLIEGYQVVYVLGANLRYLELVMMLCARNCSIRRTHSGGGEK